LDEDTYIVKKMHVDCFYSRHQMPLWKFVTLCCWTLVF